jgi:hypothetical protein
MTSTHQPQLASPRASASVVAASVFAILAGALGALFNFAALLFSARSNFPPAATYPEFIRPFVFGAWIFFLLCGLFVVVVGVQVMKLQNWARISLLIIAGCLFFFGVVGIVVIFVTLFVGISPDPLVSKGLLASVLGTTYGIPVAVSLWWLILFTRRSVVAQFQAAAALRIPANPATPSWFNNPKCPLAVRIVGWYLASFVFFLPFLPFLLGRFPAFFLGHVFHGPAALLVLTLNFALLFVPGFGLLLLRRWSYPATIASQLLLCINGIFAAFSPSFDSMMRAIAADMRLPEFPSDAMFSYVRYLNVFGLVVPLAIVVTLLVCRRSFSSVAGLRQ